MMLESQEDGPHDLHHPIGTMIAVCQYCHLVMASGVTSDLRLRTAELRRISHAVIHPSTKTHILRPDHVATGLHVRILPITTHRLIDRKNYFDPPHQLHLQQILIMGG